MRNQSNSKNHVSKFGTYIFTGSMLTGIVSLSFGLVSCGGGGGDTGSVSSVTPAMYFMTALPAASGVPGIIAASGIQPLTIYGANFASGTSVTVTNGLTSFPVSSTNVVSSSEITANVAIESVPPDSYVNVTLQLPSGNSVNGILGVAHAYRTLAGDIQTIFSNNCVSCHDSSGVFDMSTWDKSAASLIQTVSFGCSQHFRVTAGDPRRASNVLIDVIKTKVAPASVALSCNNSVARQMPQGVASALTASDIEAIVDWIALGAN